ncbi:MAG: helix-turn-helix transcriptional regulator, partial [Clostridia bacterium]|nr:helix-turn-helix transcriptional regulator [Clostridia bacterium]
MNDYDFGERLYRLRREKGLTQAELGALLGVSSKAVSKWENGVAYPRT